MGLDGEDAGMEGDRGEGGDGGDGGGGEDAEPEPGPGPDPDPEPDPELDDESDHQNMSSRFLLTLVRVISTTSTATTTPLAPLAPLPASTTSAISSTALVEDVALLLAFAVASFVATVSSEKSHLSIIFNVDICLVGGDLVGFDCNLLLGKTIVVNCGYNFFVRLRHMLIFQLISKDFLSP